MNKHLICGLIAGGLCALLYCSSPLAAGYAGPGAAPAHPGGGYTGPGPAVITIQEARQLRNDAPVTVRGKIERHIGKDKYVLRDGTGTITVEIDDKHWQGQTVNANDEVEIHGEVDKDWNSVEIDASRIIKLGN